MASHVGRLIQDQNLNVHYDASAGSKTNVNKAQRKGVLGGRKPLSDLSNSVNRTPPKQSSKKHNSNIFSFTDKEIDASKITFDGSKKKSVSGATEKVQRSNRKALSDISNTEKPHLHEASKKILNAKLSIAEEEHLSAIAEEPFLHNHEECIKAQMRAMDLDDFTSIIGLHNGHPKQSLHGQHRQRWINWSPPRYLEEEIPLLEFADCPPPQIYDHFFELDSPPSCGTPRSLDHFIQSEDEDVNFMLMKTP